jgi:hypothetical protein
VENDILTVLTLKKLRIYMTTIKYLMLVKFLKFIIQKVKEAINAPITYRFAEQSILISEK